MSWAGIASNQGVSLNNLQDAVDTSVFTLKNTIPAGTKQITKSEAAYYVNINTGYAPYAAKTSNQLVVKSNLIAATPLPYSYTVYYNYDIDDFLHYGGFSTSTAACAASTNYIVVYSNSSSITAGTEFSISPYGDDPPGQIFTSYDNGSGDIYFKIGSSYVTFENYDGTYYGYIIESVGSCAPVITCSEYYIVPDFNELAESDNGYIYFSYTDCCGVPTTLPLNAADYACVQDLSVLSLYYFVGGNPTICTASTYTNTDIPCYCGLV
jgi:hypothetical protein